MIVWCYHVLNGATVRAPIDLDTLTIDYLHVEPWQEPPLVSKPPRYCRRCKRSGRCKHTRMTEQGGRA